MTERRTCDTHHQRPDSLPAVSRRRFLQGMGAAAVGLLAGCSAGRRFISIPTRAPAATPPSIDIPTPLPTTTLAPTSPPVAAASYPDYWPTDGWRTSIPEQQGMDSEQLTRMIQYIQDQNLNLHSILIVRNGYVVTDAYIHPFTRGSKHNTHSCAKSIISALVGIAIDKGYIESVDQPVLDLFPERSVGFIDSNKEAMTLEHVLTMTAGLECQESRANGWRTLSQMTQTKQRT